MNRYSTERIKYPCSGTLDDSMAGPGFWKMSWIIEYLAGSAGKRLVQSNEEIS